MTIKRIWIIMRAEFVHILRDPLSSIIALFMPVFMLFLCGYSFCFEFKELPLAVFDMDQSKDSRAYIQAVDNTSYFHIKYHLSEYDQAKNLLDRTITRCVIIIPSSFSRKIKDYQPAQIQTIVDGTEIASAHFIINYLSAITASYSKDLISSLFKTQGISVDLEPVVLSSRIWYNQSLRDFTFVITNIFSLTIMAFVPILSALAIVREKESGSILQIFVSPIHAYEYIAGKMIPYVLLLTFDFISIIVIGIWWFGLPFRGNFFILSIATFLMVFATVAIGFLIPTLTRSQLTAMLLAIIFTLMPAIIFGDTLAPIQNSPKVWRIYACLFPARFYTGLCRTEILKGTGILTCWEDALSLVIYCAAIFSLCALRVKNKKI